MNTRDYNYIRKKYALYIDRKRKLYGLLEGFTSDMFLGKNIRIFEEQMENESILPSKYISRFVRNIAEVEKKKYIVSNGKFPPMFECKPEISFPSESEYLSFSNEQKASLEADIYKGLAIISARMANLYNRSKESNSQALSKKALYMEDFLEFACKYNSLVKEEHQIFFGFDKDSRGAVLLSASLPGYSRLSVHFGSKRNFNNILLSVNDSLGNDGFRPGFPTFKGKIDGKQLISDRVFDRYEYSIPTFSVKYNGVINRDEGTFGHKLVDSYEDAFRQSIYLNNGAVDLNGLEDFLYIYCEDIGEKFNDREIFQLAERAGSGKGILKKLHEVVKRREVLNKNAKKNHRTLMEEFFYSLDSNELTKRMKNIIEKSQHNYDFVYGIIMSMGFDPNSHDINAENLVMLLKKTTDPSIRKKLFDVANEEYGENAPPLRDVLKAHLDKYSQKKMDVHSQLMDLTKNVPSRERNKIGIEEKKLLAWLNSDRSNWHNYKKMV